MSYHIYNVTTGNEGDSSHDYLWLTSRAELDAQNTIDFAGAKEAIVNVVNTATGEVVYTANR